MRSPCVDQGAFAYGSARQGGIIAEFLAQKIAWYRVPLAARRFIFDLDARDPAFTLPPLSEGVPSADPMDDHPCTVMPAERIVRLLDDRSGPESRSVSVAELVSLLERDWVSRLWAFDIHRSGSVSLDHVVAIAIDHWIEHAEPLEPHRRFDVILTDTETPSWRTVRHPLPTPEGAIGAVADLLIDMHGGRVTESAGRRCIVAVPGSDLLLEEPDDSADTVRVSTRIGERHHKHDELRLRIESMRSWVDSQYGLDLVESSYGWDITMEKMLDTNDELVCHDALWTFLQVAEELRPALTPWGS